METIWTYITSDEFTRVGVLFLAMMAIMVVADLLDMYNSESVKKPGGQQPSANRADKAGIP
jgi:hypothetical protein